MSPQHQGTLVFLGVTVVVCGLGLYVGIQRQARDAAVKSLVACSAFRNAPISFDQARSIIDDQHALGLSWEDSERAGRRSAGCAS